MSKPFSLRTWLNDKGSHSSGSVFAYHGKAPWKGGGTVHLLEVSDCHGKIRLHKTDADTNKAFIRKLKRLRNVIDKFIDHLESQ